MGYQAIYLREWVEGITFLKFHAAKDEKSCSGEIVANEKSKCKIAFLVPYQIVPEN